MAWNQPANKSGKERKHQARRLSPWLWIALIAIVGTAALWLMPHNKEIPSSIGDDNKPATIADVGATAANASPAPVEEEAIAEPEIPYWQVDASQTNGFTREMQMKWEHRHRPKYKFDNPKRKPRAKYRIFTHRSENEIAALLMATPGASMVGRPNYHGLTEDFMKSCEEPIIVSPEDDEYTRNLKQEMIQTKIELRQRLADGETLEQIIEDTRAEYRKLSEYKRTLTKEVMDMIRKEDVNATDIDLFVDAANKMLESKGIAPIRMSGITKQWIINNRGDL